MSHRGEGKSRGGKRGHSNKPIFPQPLCLSKQTTQRRPRSSRKWSIPARFELSNLFLFLLGLSGVGNCLYDVAPEPLLTLAKTVALRASSQNFYFTPLHTNAANHGFAYVQSFVPTSPLCCFTLQELLKQPVY